MNWDREFIIEPLLLGENLPATINFSWQPGTEMRGRISPAIKN